MFVDRKDAGKKLARALEKYKDSEVLVLAIPRGGVEVGFEVAKYLDADFSMIITRKLPIPNNPEAGFGAIAEDGSIFIFKDASRWLSANDVKRIVAEQRQEIKRRIKVFRENQTLPEIKDRIVILVDDGLAMGSTMRASIMLCKNRDAGKIVVAVPVAGQETVFDFEKLADEIVVLEVPPYFRAVAQVYHYWHDATDEEVKKILEEWKKEKIKKVKV